MFVEEGFEVRKGHVSFPANRLLLLDRRSDRNGIRSGRAPYFEKSFVRLFQKRADPRELSPDPVPRSRIHGNRELRRNNGPRLLYHRPYLNRHLETAILFPFLKRAARGIETEDVLYRRIPESVRILELRRGRGAGKIDEKFFLKDLFDLDDVLRKMKKNTDGCQSGNLVKRRGSIAGRHRQITGQLPRSLCPSLDSVGQNFLGLNEILNQVPDSLREFIIKRESLEI